MVGIALGGFLSGAAEKGSEIIEGERAADQRREELAERYKQEMGQIRERFALTEELEKAKEKEKRDLKLEDTKLTNEAYTRLASGEDFPSVAKDYPTVSFTPSAVADLQKLDPTRVGAFKGKAVAAETSAAIEAYRQQGYTEEQAQQMALSKDKQVTTIYTGDHPEVAASKNLEQFAKDITGFLDLENEVDQIESLKDQVGGASREAVSKVSGFFRGLAQSGRVVVGENLVSEAMLNVGQALESDQDRTQFRALMSTVAALGSSMKAMSGESGMLTERDIQRMYEIMGAKIATGDPISVQAGVTEVRRMVLQRGLRRLNSMKEAFNLSGGKQGISPETHKKYQSQFISKFAARPKTKEDYELLLPGTIYFNPKTNSFQKKK